MARANDKANGANQTVRVSTATTLHNGLWNRRNIALALDAKGGASVPIETRMQRLWQTGVENMLPKLYEAIPIPWGTARYEQVLFM